MGVLAAERSCGRDLAESWFGVLRALVAHASQPGAGGRSPSDLRLVSLTQGEIEGVERAYPGLEDILPLTPLQEGLLFHALYDARAPDVYTVQLELELAGRLDEGALAGAVAALLDRHASLRASFCHEGLSRPVQVIVRDARPRWRRLDLSAHDEASRAAGVAELLGEERGERFDLSSAPLLRLALIRLGPERHLLAVTNHHLLLDGWSLPVLVGELLTLYGQGATGGATTAAVLPRVTPYRDYLAWVAGQAAGGERGASLAFWGDALSGLDGGTLLASADRGRAAVAPEQIVLSLSQELTSALQRQARAQALTLNSVLQGAWAILLGRLTGRDDVVFGVTVAGRPAELAGVERMVGLFINTLPQRVRVSAGLRLRELLRDVQARQSGLLSHQHVGLSEIQQAAGVGELFDTLVVFENYPVEQLDRLAVAGGVRLEGVRGRDATHYPLSLLAQPGERLRLRMDYRGDLFDRASIETLGERLVRLLEAVVAEPDCAIGCLDILGPDERALVLESFNASTHAR